MSLQYIQKNVGMNLGVSSQASSKYPKKQVCNIFAISKKNVKNELDFLPADERQRFLQIDTIILGVCVARHAQITQNNKFAI